MLAAVKKMFVINWTSFKPTIQVLWALSVTVLFASGAVNAAQQVMVNEAQVMVDDQSQRTQQKALKQALSQVFLKMTGSSSVLNNEGIRAALSSPQSFLRSYRFAFENAKTYYVAEFDKQKLTTLIQQELLPLWGDRRPETIVWLVEEGASDNRTILDESMDSDLKNSLIQTAKQRGVPVSLPLMDLTDSVNITTYDVWGRFIEPLRNASVRYTVDNIIGARIYRNDPSNVPKLLNDNVTPGTVETLAVALEKEQEEKQRNAVSSIVEESGATEGVASVQIREESGDNGEDPEQTETNIMPFSMDEFAEHAKRADHGEYALDWVFIGQKKVSYGSIYGDSPQALGFQLIEAYSNYLSSLYAIVGIEESKREVVEISVANIGSVSSYASATSYLNSLSVIDSATLVEQQGTVATYSVTLLGTIDDFLNSIKLESKLKRVTDANGQKVKGHSFYWSN
ncbi:hypothetical protein BK026_05410 [Alteromonas sp. V450]|uniref:DUF2066 domain-containing protein n=1 Tax=Alteromonas sp. V450 TaxID=1912139 RepID=UPI0008FF4C32|nr:DUF2066 domain-containing protein [Alteromonas sp. V450]OJF68264.1 hypothetical protein BK026_05410 [Alteromonas sp. V450]